MTYHFMGANTPKNDATTTTDGLQDVELVLKSEQGGRSSHREKERFTELGEVKVMTERGGWKEVCAEKPASGNEEAVVRSVKRRNRVIAHSARSLLTRSATLTECTRLSFMQWWTVKERQRSSWTPGYCP